MRISDWSSDVCSSDLHEHPGEVDRQRERMARPRADIGDEREQRVAQPRHRPPVRIDDLKQDLPARPVRLAVEPPSIGDAKPVGEQSGRATCRARGCRYWWNPGGAVLVNKKKNNDEKI